MVPGRSDVERLESALGRLDWYPRFLRSFKRFSRGTALSPSVLLGRRLDLHSGSAGKYSYLGAGKRRMPSEIARSHRFFGASIAAPFVELSRLHPS